MVWSESWIRNILTLNYEFLGRKIESFQYNANDNIIAAIQDTHLKVWYCPIAAFNSKLSKLSSLHYESPELGRSPRIHDFVGSSVEIRRADGSLLIIPISPFPSFLHKYEYVIYDLKYIHLNYELKLVKSKQYFFNFKLFKLTSWNELIFWSRHSWVIWV